MSFYHLHKKLLLLFFIILTGCGDLGGGKSSVDGDYYPGVYFSYENSELTVDSNSSASNYTLGGEVTSGSSVTLRFTPRDQNGRLFTGSLTNLQFEYSGGTSTGSISEITKQSNGSYTATFQATNAGTAIYFSAKVSGKSLLSSPPSVQVGTSGFSPEKSILTLSASTLASGSSAVVTVTLKDQNGNTVTQTTQTVSIIFSLTGGSTGNFGTLTPNLDGTYSSVVTGIISGSASILSATINAVAAATPLPTLTVVPGNTSSAQSLLSTSSNSISAGSTTLLTLTSKDTAGNLVTVGGQVVSFGITSGTSSGSFSPVIDLGNGMYTSTFTGTTSGSSTTFTATIDGSLLTSTLPTFQVIPGAADLSQSIVSLSNSSIASGSNVTATMQLKDFYGNTILSSQGTTVSFSKVGAGSSTVQFSTVQDQLNGTYTSQVTGVVSGSAIQIQGSLSGSALSTLSPSLTVVPGSYSLSQSLVSVSASSISSGNTSALTLTAKDAAGNLILNGGLTVLFSNAGGTSNGTISGTSDVGNGTYTATFTGTTSGTATTIQATIGGSNVTSSLPTILVSPGVVSLSHSVISVSSSTIQSGNTSTLTLTAKDASGNQIPSGGLTVVFSRTGGTSSGTISGTSDVGNGTYTATFTGTTSGTATTIQATIGGSSVTSSLPTILVNPGAVSLSQSFITVSSSTIQSGNTSTLTLTAKDANGNQLSSGGLTIVFSRSGGTSNGTISGTSDIGNGTYTATFTGTTSGTATTIQATIGGLSVTSTLPTVTVNPGAYSLSQSTISVSASTVLAGGTVTLTLTAKDANNNLILSGSPTIVFTQSAGTSSGTIGSVTDQGNGTHTATFTATIAGSPTSIGASINGSALTSTLPTIDVDSGAISLAQSSVSVSASTIASGYGVTVTVTAKDAYGNQKETGGATVAVARSGGTSNGGFSVVSSGNNGTYTSTFTGTTSGTATTITATINGSSVTSTLPTVTVVPGDPASLAWNTQPNTSRVAGVNFTTGQIKVLDASGNLCTNLSDMISFEIDGSNNPTGTSLMGTVDVALVGGYASLTAANIQIVGTGYKIIASLDSLNSPLSGAVSVTVAATNKLTFTQIPSAVPAGSPFTSNVLVAVTDAFGNVVTSGGGVSSIVVSIGTNPSAGTLSGTLTRTLTSGVATFNDLSINNAGDDYTLNAVGGSFNGTSPTFDISSASGQNLEHAIELFDSGLGSKSGTGTFAYTSTRTNVNTTNYNGSPTYQFEIVASNTTTAAVAAQLINSAGTVVSTINIPASTAVPTLLPRVNISMTAGANNYRIQLPRTTTANTVQITSGRIIIKQTNAYNTRVYIPLLSDTHTTVGSAPTIIDSTTSTTFTQIAPQKYAIWKKNDSWFSTLPTSNAFTLEVVMANATNGQQLQAALFNRTTNQQVTGAIVSSTSSTVNVFTVSFNSNAVNFTDGDEFELRIRAAGGTARVYKANLWVSVQGLTKFATYWRTSKLFTGLTNSVIPTSRVIFDQANFSTPNVQFECSASLTTSGNAVLELATHGTNNSGTSSTSGISLSTLYPSSLVKALYPSPTNLSITNGDRHLTRVSGSTGTIDSTQCLTIIRN